MTPKTRRLLAWLGWQTPRIILTIGVGILLYGFMKWVGTSDWLNGLCIGWWCNEFWTIQRPTVRDIEEIIKK